MPQDDTQHGPTGRPASDAAQGSPPDDHPHPPPRSHWLRWTIIAVVAGGAVVVALIFGIPWLIDYFHTVSTDDAFVGGHVSMISARVTGHVTAVRVENNDRVRKGDLLMELDPQPYQVAVNQKRAALEAAEANVNAAVAEARAQEAAARSNWYALIGAQEQVRYQEATLHSELANLRLQEANLNLAKKETDRVRKLAAKDAATREELDQRVADEQVAQQRVVTAQEALRQTRAALGLPPNDEDPTELPPNFEQNYSGVQGAVAATARSLAQIGVPLPLHRLSSEELGRYLNSQGGPSDVNQTLEQYVEKAPAVAQARAARDQAQEDLRAAELNLDYTQVHAPIDGEVFRRNVNPGDNVASGQAMLAVRSLTDVWIEANFKETEIDNLRIGMAVEVHVDAYPKKTFRGRVEGFSAGTGSSIALIPPENATGNFVKIVQRLPVRVTIDPRDLSDDTPLFAGLSCEPKVLYTQSPTGPNAGGRLLPPIPPPANPSTQGASEPDSPQPAPTEGDGR